MQFLLCVPSELFQVVEAPVDSVVLPDGAALSAFQYFENVRNFLVAVQEIGLPTFEASDLEQVRWLFWKKKRNWQFSILLCNKL